MKKFKGNVIFAKMPKTVVVEVRSSKTHPLYKKTIWVKKKYLAHDEIGVSVGDEVVLLETRPISKTKRWKVIEVRRVKRLAQNVYPERSRGRVEGEGESGKGEVGRGKSVRRRKKGEVRGKKKESRKIRKEKK